jgi:hypothetical protein
MIPCQQEKKLKELCDKQLATAKAFRNIAIKQGIILAIL